MKKKLLAVILFVGILFEFSVLTIAQEPTSKFVEYAPQYKHMTRFDNAVSAVRSGSDYALISPNNKETAKINGEILGYSDHVTRIYRDGKIIFRSDAGVEFLSIAGIFAKPIMGGKVAVQDDNFVYGLYNDKGEILLAHDYTNIIYGIGDHILLQSETGWMEYDVSQNSVVEEYDKVYSSDDEYAICSVDEKVGVINFEGDLLIPFQFDKIGVSGDTFIAYSGDTTSCYDTEGNVLYSDETGICGSFSEEMYYNNTDDVHTYKSSAGSVMIDLSDIAEIEFGEPFYDGYAVIQTTGKKTYIDASGAMMTEQMWDDAYRFSNGFALVMNRIADSETSTYHNQWYIINEDFEIVKTLDYDVYVDTTYPASTDFSDGYIRTIDRDTGLMGFIRLDEFDFAGDSSSIIVNAIGSGDDIPAYTIDGQIVTVMYDIPCKIGYQNSNGIYVSLSAMGNAAGSYSYQVPEGITEVVLVVSGDINSDGIITLADSTRAKAVYNNKITVTAEQIFAADVNNDGDLTLADSTRIKAVYNNKVNLSW